MRKRLVNQQCLSRRLLQLSLLCATMLAPLGAWAGEFTKTYNYFWQDTQSNDWKNYFCADATKESGFIMGTITNVTIYSPKKYYRVSSVKVVAGVVAAAADFDNANVTVSANGQTALTMTVTPSSQYPDNDFNKLNTLPTQEYSFTFADAPLENQEVAITITNNANPKYGDNGGIDLYVKSVTVTYESNVTVGGVAVTQENESGISGSNIEGTVAYDSDTNTLTLTNANIKSGGIQTDDDLIIKVIGSPNYINGYITTTKENATLTFKKGSNAEAALQINQSYTETKSGFSTVNYDGMYLTADNDRNTKYSSKRQRFENSNSSMPSSVKLSSAKTYELWVGGTKVTEQNQDAITSDFLTATESGKEFSVNYDPNSHKLTLNNVTLNGSGISNYGIISRLPALTIYIEGANEIICNDTCTAIRADAEIKQSLTFTTNSWTVGNYSLAFKAKKAIRDFNEVELDYYEDLYWNNSYEYVNGKLVDCKGNEVQDKSAVIGDTEYYGLSVGGVEVTNKNYSNITGGAIVSGKFSYDYYEKVLTIDGSDNPAMISSTEEYGILNKKLSSLTVKLKGQCTINTSSSEDTNPIHSVATNDNGVTLKLVKDEDYSASTSLALMSNPQMEKSVISGFTSVNFSSFATLSATGGPIEVGYNDDVLWMLNNNSEPAGYATDVIFVPAYNLWVNGERVTDDNKDAILINYILSGSSIKFNSVTKTLTLNNVDGVEFDSTVPFIKNGLGNMTIHVVGENELHCGQLFLTQYGQSESTYNVTFTTNPAVPGSLVVKNSSNQGGAWYTGHTLTMRNELTLTETPWTDQTMYSLATIQVPSNLTTYGLVVGGVTVTPDNAQNIAEGHNWIELKENGELSFNPESNTLTMKDVTITMPDGESAPYPAIVSGLDHLTVNISGYNSLNFSGGETYGIQSTNANAELVITKNTVEEEASLSIGTSKPAFDGFKSVTYENGLLYDKSNLIIKGLETPSPYSYYNYQEKALEVGMEFAPIDGVTVYYSIDYVDESKQDVENAVYDGNATLFISYPCTFTAYSQYGEYTSPVFKAKAFAFAEPTITAQYGVDVTVNAPTLLPAVENTDQITVRYAEYIEQVAPALNPTADTPVAEIDETTGVMTINKPGTIKFVADCTSDVVECWNLGEDEAPTFILTVNDVDHGIIITKDDVTVSVTNSNRSNVLNDANATVKFDGHSRLVLNGAELTSIVVSTTNDLPETGLDVYLEGDSKITNALGYAIESEGAAAMVKLAFHTSGDAPGTLTYTNSGSASGNVFPGFVVTYFNKLAEIVDENDDNKTTVMIPLNLITDDVNDPAIIDYGNDPDYSTSTALNNVTIEDVLYTLNDTQQQYAPDDGLSSQGGKLSLVINSTMTDLQVAASDALVPGTSDYYNAYKGLTFIVPVGTGVITLYNVETGPGYAFHVRVGDLPPVEITSAEEVNVPYACSETSYVKLYLVNLATDAPAMKVDHRIGPKSSVAGALGGVKVSNSSVQSSAVNPAAPYKAMEKATMATELTKLVDPYNGYTCNDPDITDLDDNLCVVNTSAPAINPAPRRGGATNTILPEGLTFLDFSGTNITGMEVSRTSGAFNGVPENVFIYMPAGNTTKEKNVVIGDICDKVELNGSTNAKPFKAMKDFKAGQATLKRTFEAGNTDSKATIYLPYNIAQEDADKLGKFYKYTGNDGTTVSMTKVTTGGLKANMPYIFEAKEGGVIDPLVRVVDVVANPAETEGFKGVYERKEYEAGMYCYAGEDKGGKYTIGQFVEMGPGSYVPPFRAYMIGSGVPSYAIAWDGIIDNMDDDENTTAVESVKAIGSEKTREGWWTLNGMRMTEKPKKAGLYILNGRMVVVKN